MFFQALFFTILWSRKGSQKECRNAIFESMRIFVGVPETEPLLVHQNNLLFLRMFFVRKLLLSEKLKIFLHK